MCLRVCWGQSHSALCSDKHFLHYQQTNCPVPPQAPAIYSPSLRLCMEAVGEMGEKKSDHRNKRKGWRKCYCIRRLEKEQKERWGHGKVSKMQSSLDLAPAINIPEKRHAKLSFWICQSLHVPLTKLGWKRQTNNEDAVLNCGDLIHMMKMDFQCMSFYRKLNMDVCKST